MKTILVPTDFSSVAANATDYAVEIAKISGAKLILFHAFHTPVMVADIGVGIPSLDEIEKDSLKTLKEISGKLKASHGDKLQIEVVCKCGFALEEIDVYVKENKIDLIIIGMQGAGYLVEKVIGSLTTSLIAKSNCPVLSIDKNVKYKSIKKIALACDYKEIKNQSILEPLKEFVKLFKSHLYILNVIPELITVPVLEEAILAVRLEQVFEGVNHSFFSTQKEDIVEGINHFVSEKSIDMLVMIPRKHSVLNTIFNEPKTKQIAFHSIIPLLNLHE